MYIYIYIYRERERERAIASSAQTCGRALARRLWAGRLALLQRSAQLGRAFVSSLLALESVSFHPDSPLLAQQCMSASLEVGAEILYTTTTYL